MADRELTMSVKVNLDTEGLEERVSAMATAYKKARYHMEHEVMPALDRWEELLRNLRLSLERVNDREEVA